MDEIKAKKGIHGLSTSVPCCISVVDMSCCPAITQSSHSADDGSCKEVHHRHGILNPELTVCMQNATFDGLEQEWIAG